MECLKKELDTSSRYISNLLQVSLTSLIYYEYLEKFDWNKWVYVSSIPNFPTFGQIFSASEVMKL